MACRQAVLDLLAECEDFEVVGEAANGPHTLTLARQLQPQMLVLEDGPDLDGEALVRELGRQRSVPTLLLVAGHEQPSPKRRAEFKRAKISRMKRGLLMEPDGVGREHVRARLQLLGARCSDRRQTRTARSLQQEIHRIQASGRENDCSEELVGLTTWPRDLVLVVGGFGSYELLRRIVPTLATAPVPMVVALDEQLSTNVLDELRAVSPVPVAELKLGVPLRRLTGLNVALDPTSLRIEKSVVHGAPVPSDNLDEAVRSMSCLADAGLTVLLSSPDESMALALASVANAGGHVVAARPDTCLHGEASSAALRWDVSRHALNEGQIAWLLQNCVARRT